MIDPLVVPTAADIVVLTGATAWRIRGTLAALKAGISVTLVAQPALEEYLLRQGAIVGGGSREIEGLGVRLTTYTPTAAATRPREHLLKATIAAVRPAAALRRIAESAPLPTVAPSIIELSFPDGSRLLHLDLSLHGGTPEAWLTANAAQGNAEWTIAGVAYGEGAAFVQHISRFGCNRLLLAEISNGERRDLGLPTELVTPWRDRLHGTGLETHVFATRTSVRFE